MVLLVSEKQFNGGCPRFYNRIDQFITVIVKMDKLVSPPTPAETLLVEVRLEEMPPKLVGVTAEFFTAHLLTALAKSGLATTQTRAHCRADGVPYCLATARRFAALIESVPAVGAPQTLFKKGPKEEAGVKDGEPTSALKGFMRSVGVQSVDELTVVAEKQHRYFAYQKQVAGQVLAEEIAGIIESILLAQPVPRQMCWGSNTFKYIRPVRGLLVQHGETPLPNLPLFDIKSGEGTVGHPVLSSGVIRLANAEQYIEALASEGRVIVDISQRQHRIDEQSGGRCAAYPELLDEVTAMTEYPMVYQGEIGEQFLSLPKFSIEGCMVKHQRFFPLQNEGGLDSLDKHFLLVADNQPADPAPMINDFNKVLQARLQDLAFYIEQDKKLSVADCLQKLKATVYHHQLGSQFERVERLQKISAAVVAMVEEPLLDGVAAQQVLGICKADLATLLVREYPEFEGWAASYYFCPPDSPLAPLADMVRYHHTRDSSAIAQLSLTGQMVVLVNHLEKLVGMFLVGDKPTGSKDPQGCRVSAAVVSGTLTAWGKHAPALLQQLPLNKLLNTVAQSFDLQHLKPNASQGDSNSINDSINEIWQFIAERKKQSILDTHATDGITKNVINAVFATRPTNLYKAECKTLQLHQLVTQESATVAELIEINKRISNILAKSNITIEHQPAIDAALLSRPAEQQLHDAILCLQATAHQADSDNNYKKVLEELLHTKIIIDEFFEAVYVQDKNPAIRQNRLGLLWQVRQCFLTVGDFLHL